MNNQQFVQEVELIESDEENHSMYIVTSSTTFKEIDPLEGKEVEEREVIESDVPIEPTQLEKDPLGDEEMEEREVTELDVPIDPTQLERNVMEVRKRLKRGCNCQDAKCFRNLNPDLVYKHRLNIAQLTKSEHDMYLMGITMASIGNPETTCRCTERKRFRCQYVHRGRRVCLDAFVYLENCTQYQLKRIRKHVMMNGVVPRVHGNHGRKPCNTFSVDIYKHAAEFLRQHLEQYAISANLSDTKKTIKLPSAVTHKALYEVYREHGALADPGAKLMGFTTFRYFLRSQFPHIMFSKNEQKISGEEQAVECSQEVEINESQTLHIQPLETHTDERIENPDENQIENCITDTNTAQQVTPLVIAPAYDNANMAQTIFVRPMQYLLPNGTIPATIQSTNSQEVSNSIYHLPLGNSTYFNNQY